MIRTSPWAIGFLAMLLGSGALSCSASVPDAAPPACGGGASATVIDDPYAYAGAGAAWYDPGDSYPPFVDDGSGDDGSGDDTSGGDSTGSGDDSSGAGDDSSSGDDSGGSGDDSSSGDDSGGGDDSSESFTPRTKALDAPVCSTCTVVCRLDQGTSGSPPGASATASSGDPARDPCAVAQHRVAVWSHRTFGARVLACDAVTPAP